VNPQNVEFEAFGTHEAAMEQKFVSFEDAVSKLNISSERLNELRESGTLRAYRDGSSWKFRADEIDQMAADGIPDIPPPSDISLIDPSELVDAEPLPDFDLDDDFGLAELPDLELDEPRAVEPDESAMDLRMADTDAVSAGSELELAAGLEDTVTAGASDLSLDMPEEPSDPSDSILLSEEELGESVTGSLSTIIGRKELDLPDADLELELADDVMDEEDTKLSSSSGASDVLSSQVAGSGVLDEMEDLSDAKKAFKDLDELEIDLAAESSLALNPADVADVKAKGKSLTKPKGDSDLKLGDDDEVGDEGNMGSTDVPLEELAGVGSGLDEVGSDAELELAGDDDLILADAGGSDITLDSGDSGINLLPSDSGLALDDIPLDVGGSAILSSLSLEGSDPEISLLGGDSNLAAKSGADLQTDDDFQLTPLSEGGLDDGDSSSQVIALDADLGGFDGGAGLMEEGFPAEADEGVVLSEDFGEAPAGELGMGTYAVPVVVAPGAEAQYGPGAIALLSVCALFLTFCGLMMLDMIRNIWSWEEPYALNSSLLDAILGMIGLR
jgi:hypothetical protein